MKNATNKKGQPVAAGLAQDPTANIFSMPPSRQSASGAKLRDDALGRIALRADPEWLALAERELLAAIDRLGSASVDDARPNVPPPAMQRWWCIVPRLLVSRGVIERVGSIAGTFPVSHRGDLRTWRRVVAP